MLQKFIQNLKDRKPKKELVKEYRETMKILNPKRMFP